MENNRGMNNSDRIKILSPLLLFLFHMVYLAAWSPDPFLKKWIDGSFTFFIALVMCNIVRSRIVARNDQDSQPDDTDVNQDRHDQNRSEINNTP